MVYLIDLYKDLFPYIDALFLLGYNFHQSIQFGPKALCRLELISQILYRIVFDPNKIRKIPTNLSKINLELLENT